MAVPTFVPRMAIAEDPGTVDQITAKFWWWTPEIAIISSFTTDGHCVDAGVMGMPEMGAMGVRYTKQVHIDGTFNPLEPEALLFNPATNKLLGVEYIVISTTRPWAFGRAFDLFPQIPGSWALHLWLVENKSGQFSPWNPAFKCTRDPAKETVLVGEAKLSHMRIKLELEPAKVMTMLMAGKWDQMKSMPDEKYHVEVKPEDPKSNSRIAYAQVTFSATNQDTGKKVELDLHPMWGGSGLHYAANSDLPDGTYSATVMVGVPTFARGPADEDRWMTPTQAHFEFKLENGLLVSSKVVAGAAVPLMEMPSAAPTPMPGMPGM